MYLSSTKRSLRTFTCTVGLTTITVLGTVAFGADPTSNTITTVGLGSGIVKIETMSASDIAVKTSNFFTTVPSTNRIANSNAASTSKTDPYAL